MARIVIDARESGTSTGRYIDKLVEYLHKLQTEHQILILTKKHRVDFIRTIAPNFEVIESNFKEFTFAEQLGFLKQLRNLKADLVHFGMTHQPILYRGKTITTIHDLTTARFHNPAKNPLVFKFKQWVYRDVIWLVAHKSTRLITPTRYVKKDLVGFAHIDRHKVKVTYESADKIPDAPKIVGSLLPGTFIMYVGRPLPHKNLKRLAEAFSIIKHKKPVLKLVIVGAKHPLYDEFEKWAKREHIEGLVLTGFVDEAELRWLYENCAAYVFPSLSEGFGLPGLEAMAHGAPVISSNTTCLPEVYGNAAHYFDPLNVKDMVDKIDEVISNPLLKNQLVNKGKAQAAKYSWQRMAEQTLQTYNEVLS
jgi:glycosyltransferase involved in cell wall biosynthesis